MKISMIAAMGENRVIGKDNDLIWSLPDDMSYFMRTTRGHHVIMGRKNFESIPEKYRPLPKRVNIILTRQEEYVAEGAIVVHNLVDAINIAETSGEEEAFIIGGGEIYKLALPQADILYLTEINQSFDGDAWFPEFDKSKWKEVSRKHHPADEKHAFSFDFVTYHRK